MNQLKLVEKLEDHAPDDEVKVRTSEGLLDITGLDYENGRLVLTTDEADVVELAKRHPALAAVAGLGRERIETSTGFIDVEPEYMVITDHGDDSLEVLMNRLAMMGWRYEDSLGCVESQFRAKPIITVLMSKVKEQ